MNSCIQYSSVILLGVIVGYTFGFRNKRANPFSLANELPPSISILSTNARSDPANPTTLFERRLTKLRHCLKGGDTEQAYRYLASWLFFVTEKSARSDPEIMRLLTWLCENHPDAAVTIQAKAAAFETNPLYQLLIRTMAGTSRERTLTMWQKSGRQAQDYSANVYVESFYADDPKFAKQWLDSLDDSLRRRTWKTYYKMLGRDDPEAAVAAITENEELSKHDKAKAIGAALADNPRQLIAAIDKGDAQFSISDMPGGWLQRMLPEFGGNVGQLFAWLDKHEHPWSAHEELEELVREWSHEKTTALPSGDDSSWNASTRWAWIKQATPEAFRLYAENALETISTEALITVLSASSWASREPQMAKQWALQHSANEHVADFVSELVRSLPDDKRPHFIEELNTTEMSPQLREAVWEQQLRDLDPFAVAEWLAEHPEHVTAVRDPLGNGANWQPVAMLESFRNQAPSEAILKGSEMVLERWLGNDYEGARQAVYDLPIGSMRTRLAKQLASYTARFDPQGAIDLTIETMADGEVRAQTLESLRKTFTEKRINPDEFQWP